MDSFVFTEEAALLDKLAEEEIDMIVLAGFLKILSPRRLSVQNATASVCGCAWTVEMSPM